MEGIEAQTRRPCIETCTAARVIQVTLAVISSQDIYAIQKTVSSRLHTRIFLFRQRAHALLWRCLFDASEDVAAIFVNLLTDIRECSVH